MSVRHQAAESFYTSARHPVPGFFLGNPVISTQMSGSTSVRFYGSHDTTLCVLDTVVISVPSPDSYTSSIVGKTSRQEKKRGGINKEVLSIKRKASTT